MASALNIDFQWSIMDGIPPTPWTVVPLGHEPTDILEAYVINWECMLFLCNHDKVWDVCSTDLLEPAVRMAFMKEHNRQRVDLLQRAVSALLLHFKTLRCCDQGKQLVNMLCTSMLMGANAWDLSLTPLLSQAEYALDFLYEVITQIALSPYMHPSTSPDNLHWLTVATVSQ